MNILRTISVLVIRKLISEVCPDHNIPSQALVLLLVARQEGGGAGLEYLHCLIMLAVQQHVG